MALETGTFISDLVTTNPTASDPKSAGDDHIRLVKSTIKATFPNITGAVTYTQAQINASAQRTGDTYTGTHDFSGASGGLTLASRVRAEYSNATPSSRSLFQSSVTNGQTLIGAMPNGTSAVSGSRYYNASTPDNSGFIGYRIDLTEARIEASRNGSGAFLPINLYTSDILRFSVSTAGAFSLNGATTITGATSIIGNTSITGALAVSGAVSVPTPVSPADAVTKAYADGLSFATALPAQAGNAGKFVTTNGTTASWGSPINVQTFSASGTWTKPATANFVLVEAIGGGGGGGSGRRGAAGGRRGGGGGGGGGGLAIGYFLASALGATETVTVGAGGTIGAAVTVNDTNGNAGGTGGTSSFGSYLLALGGNGGGAGNTAATAAGTGGSGAASISGTGATGGAFNGTTGVAGTSTIQTLATGGGGGSATDTGGVAQAATAAGASGSGANLLAGGIAGTAGSVGGAGNTAAYSLIGTGGGGGSLANDTSTGSAGGAGTKGGGGGGGSCSANGFNSGAGGLGGDGLIRVTTW